MAEEHFEQILSQEVHTQDYSHLHLWGKNESIPKYRQEMSVVLFSFKNTLRLSHHDSLFFNCFNALRIFLRKILRNVSAEKWVSSVVIFVMQKYFVFSRKKRSHSISTNTRKRILQKRTHFFCISSIERRKSTVHNNEDTPITLPYFTVRATHSSFKIYHPYEFWYLFLSLFFIRENFNMVEEYCFFTPRTFSLMLCGTPVWTTSTVTELLILAASKNSAIFQNKADFDWKLFTIKKRMINLHRNGHGEWKKEEMKGMNF